MLPSLSPGHLPVKLPVYLLDGGVLPERTLGLLSLGAWGPAEGILVLLCV